MEMPGPWKVGKSKSSFSPLSTAPWESRQRREIPTLPTAWHCPGWKSGKPKSGFPLSHAGHATTSAVCLFSEPINKKGDRPLRDFLNHVFQDHARLETELSFRIILRLENALTGSLTTYSGRIVFAIPQ